MNEELIAAIAAEMVQRGRLPGKKSFQKLFYLIEKSGVPTDLDFEMHIYGPYSSALADEMVGLERAGILRIEDGSIEPGERAGEARAALADELRSHLPEVAKVLDVFGARTGLQLELAATTHLVASWLIQRQGRTTKSEVVAAVRQQKGDKFSGEQISKAIDELTKFGLLNGGISG
jgi:uncharacterized protein YwgA